MGWVHDIENPLCAQTDADAAELDHLCAGIEGRACRSPIGARKFGVATCTADVIRVFEVKVAVGHETACFD